MQVLQQPHLKVEIAEGFTNLYGEQRLWYISSNDSCFDYNKSGRIEALKVPGMLIIALLIDCFSALIIAEHLTKTEKYVIVELYPQCCPSQSL